MVTETAVEEVVDQEPVQQEQTEEAPQVDLTDLAAEPPDTEAATETEEPEPEEEPVLPVSEAQRRIEEARQQAYWEAQEQLRRQTQSENGRRAAEARKAEETRQETAELLAVELYKLGLPDADTAKLAPILDRYAGKFTGKVEAETLAETADALEVVSATVLNLRTNTVLSPKAAEIAQRLDPYVRQVAQQAIQRMAASGEFIHKSQIPELYKAWQSAAQKNGKPAVKRATGAAPDTIDRSKWAVIARVASGVYDAQDETDAKKYTALE